MIEPDTIKLLRECDAGIKMGVSSIEEVLDYVHDEKFKEYLSDCKSKHDKLKEEIETLLEKYNDDGKEPNPMAKSMSWIKTNMKLVMNESDETIADLITDGCNMGIKSLNKYLNQYKAADEKTKDIAKRLINLEEKLAIDIRCYFVICHIHKLIQLCIYINLYIIKGFFFKHPVNHSRCIFLCYSVYYLRILYTCLNSG